MIRIPLVGLITTLIAVIVVVLPSLSFPREQNEIKGVGFASMEKFSFDSKLWDHHFSRLAKESYLFKYSSFRQIAAKLQVRDMYPFGIELPSNGKKVVPANDETVSEFFRRFHTEGDEYLRNLALANNAALVIFDYVEKMDVELFIQGETNQLAIRIMVYYLDSNALGVNHIIIDKECFNEKFVDYPEIKTEVHGKILEALEDAVTNTRGLLMTDNFGVDSEKESGKRDENAGSGYEEGSGKQGGSKEESGGKSDVIDDSYLSDEEKSGFWE